MPEILLRPDLDDANADWPKRTPDKVQDLGSDSETKDYDEAEHPRDEAGRWTEVGGGGDTDGETEDAGDVKVTIHALADLKNPRLGDTPENRRHVRRIQRLLKTIPSTHTDGLNAVILNHPADQNLPSVIGTYKRDLHQVWIKPVQAEAEGLPYTAVHEVGHHVHLMRLTDDAAVEWAIVSKGGQSAQISTYAQTNTTEHFAEAYMAYATPARRTAYLLGGEWHAETSRDHLRAVEPKAHAFMARLFGPEGASMLRPPKEVTDPDAARERVRQR